jgi:CRP/FNR family transcriptional regulator, cyclic AMP receptor protein
MPRVIDPQDLRQIPLFQLLDDNELAALTDQLEVRKYWKGQMVFWQGSPGDTMFLVHSGQVELFIKDKNGDVVNLNCAEPGDMFGELALLDQQPRSANAKATADTTLLVIDQNDLRQLFQAYPAAAFDIMAMLSRRIREADVLLSERVVARNVNDEMVAERSINQRLADFFSMIAGDMRFVYASGIFFAVWIGWNTNLIPGLAAFDPFPFGLLTTIVSLEAIFLSTFVLVSANRQAERDKVRNDIEYEINVKAELEIKELHDKVDRLEDLLASHLNKLDSRMTEVNTSVRQAAQTTLPRTVNGEATDAF